MNQWITCEEKDSHCSQPVTIWDDLVICGDWSLSRCVGHPALEKSHCGGECEHGVCVGVEGDGRSWQRMAVKRTLGNLPGLPCEVDRGETTGKESGPIRAFSCCSLLFPSCPASLQLYLLSHWSSKGARAGEFLEPLFRFCPHWKTTVTGPVGTALLE